MMYGIAELQSLAIAARRLSDGLLQEPPSRLPVGGTELSGYRDYAPGDDHRHIDWSVCARHDELRVRLFSGRRDWHVYLLVDCSASMGLGSKVTRFDAARRIAAAVGYVALDRQACLSVFGFSDRIYTRIGPLRGKARVGRLLREVGELPSPQGTTDFRRTADTFVRLTGDAGAVVIISDLCDTDSFLSGIDVLRTAGRSPRVVHLIDPAEDDGLSRGDIELVDAESGATWQVTLTDSQLRRYRRLAAEDRQRPGRHCRKTRVPYVRADIAAEQRKGLADILAMRSPST